MTRGTTTVVGRFTQAVAWVVVAAVVVVLSIVVLLPRAAGATPYTVLSGSMEPTLEPGTLVVTRPVDFDDIALGQVITFQLESGEPTVATHRVIGRADAADGGTVLITQGDANGSPDPTPVQAEQVRGAVWYSVPELGRVNTVIGADRRQQAATVVGFGLLAYAGFSAAGALRERRSRPAPELQEVTS